MSLLHESDSLKKTPLFGHHRRLGAKMVDFGGWSMPVQYTSILEEHLSVRNSCGFFDVSHLGEIKVSGSGALVFLQKMLTSDIRKAVPGKIVYALLCHPNGTVVDDLLVYGAEKNEYYLIVNASNTEVDYQTLITGAEGDVCVENVSHQMGCVAVQGPRAEEVMVQGLGLMVSDMGYYTYGQFRMSFGDVWVSRSGYTGEDGFEIFVPRNQLELVWEMLIGKEGLGIAKPAGLGARNTLRLEAGNPLYGHELNDQTTPLEAGMKFVVDFDKGDFVGRAALEAQLKSGVQKTLVGFKMMDRSIARDGYRVLAAGREIGSVTSGSFAPSVGCGVGMAYVPPSCKKLDTEIEIEVHGRLAKAVIAKRPFVAINHKKSRT